MGQEVLGETRLHEDFLDLVSADETVHVGVCLEKDVVVSAAL